MSNTTYRVLVEKLGDSDPEQFVGNEGDVFYDPIGTSLRLSDGTTPGGIVLGGGGNAWVRPTDWLAMPTITETEEKFVGLFAVYDAPENFIAVHFEGDYTVDWGDGTVENISSGVKAQHSYAWSDISSSTLTSDGYRQVLVTVTPQSGQNLTVLDLSVRHDNIANSGGDTNTPWLDLAISMPMADSGNSIRFNWDVSGALGSGYLRSTQKIDLIHTGSMNDFSYAMYYNVSLRYVRIRNSPSATNFNNIFSQCPNLTEVILEDTSSVTNMNSMFSGCVSLASVPLFDTSSVTSMNGMFNSCSSLDTLPLLNTSLVDSMNGMFGGCSSLTSVPLFDTSSVTDMTEMFTNCQSLISVPLFNTSSSSTSMYNMFGNCFSLISVPLLDVSAYPDMDSMFSNCFSLQTGALSGTVVNISYQNCLLNRDSIVDIFNNLGTVVSQTINVSGNYGAAELTAGDIQIATDKGWTVTT